MGKTDKYRVFMGILARFWNWLTTSATGKPRKAHPDLYPLNVDKLAKELNLVAEARRLGEAGLPRADAKVLTGPEAAIVQRVEKARQDYVDWAVLRLNILDHDLGRIDVTQDVNRAIQAVKEFEGRAGTLLTEQISRLRGLNEAARKRKEELDEFKTKNNITRDAHYPTSTRAYLLYGILALLIVVESVLNAGFFAQGLDTGLLGGFAYAGMLATMNVSMAFMFGKFGVRYINDSSAAWKFVGILALALSLLIISFMGLSIAHYRDSLTAEVTDAARVALNTLLSDPLQLKDLFSWALFAISVIFGLLSLFDGLLSDDLYPRYGSISRRTQSAIDDYEDELSTLRSNLEELKMEELKSLDNVVQNSQSCVARIEALIDDKRVANSRLSTALLDADHSLEALLQKFRTENEIYRNGTPRPKYFNQPPAVRPLNVPAFNIVADESALTEQRALVSALLASNEDIRARIQAAFSLQFDRLKPLGTHFSDTGMT